MKCVCAVPYGAAITALLACWKVCLDKYLQLHSRVCMDRVSGLYSVHIVLVVSE